MHTTTACSPDTPHNTCTQQQPAFRIHLITHAHNNSLLSGYTSQYMHTTACSPDTPHNTCTQQQPAFRIHLITHAHNNSLLSGYTSQYMHTTACSPDTPHNTCTQQQPALQIHLTTHARINAPLLPAERRVQTPALAAFAYCSPCLEAQHVWHPLAIPLPAPSGQSVSWPALIW